MRRDHRLRRAGADRRAVRRPGRRGAAVGAARRVHRRARRPRLGDRRGQARGGRAGPVRRGAPAGRPAHATICHDDIALRDHTRRALHDAVDRAARRLRPLPGLRRARRAGAARSRWPWSRRRPSGPGRSCRRSPARRSSSSATSCWAARSARRPPSRAGGTRGRSWSCAFQQTCGPVMAKGVEDTAFYRWYRLVSLNEVGGDPGHFGVPPEEFHAFAAAPAPGLADHDDHAVDPRHQAVGGRPGPARGAGRAPRGVGEAVRAWRESAGRYRSAEGWPDPAASTSCGRRWSACGAAGLAPAGGRPPDRLPRRRRCGRPSSTPRGPTRTPTTRPRWSPSPRPCSPTAGWTPRSPSSAT